MKTFTCFDCDTELGELVGPQGKVVCTKCKAQWDFAQITHPTFTPVKVTPRPRTTGASCYNHEENEAESECSCGKFLCSVCAMTIKGEPACPECYVSPDVRDPILKTQRVFRYDWAARRSILLTLITGGLAAPLAIYYIVKYAMSTPLYGTKGTTLAVLIIILTIILFFDLSFVALAIIGSYNH